MSTIFQRFDYTKRAIINPEHVIERDPNFPKICITTFSADIIDRYVDANDAREIGNIYTANGSFPIYEFEYKGNKIAIFLSRVGGPACACGIEEVIALGAEKIVMFGSCGVLNEETVQDNIIVPTAAIRDEGTSYHYIPASEEITVEQKSVDVLIQCLEMLQYPYVVGKVWTTDAIYRETEKVVKERKQEDCLAVEMECASVLAVTQFRNIPFLQFLYGADCLDGDEWDMRDLNEYGVRGSEKFMLLACECGIHL